MTSPVFWLTHHREILSEEMTADPAMEEPWQTELENILKEI